MLVNKWQVGRGGAKELAMLLAWPKKNLETKIIKDSMAQLHQVNSQVNKLKTSGQAKVNKLDYKPSTKSSRCNKKKSWREMEKIMHSLLNFLGISLYCFKKLWAYQFQRSWIAFVLSIAIEIPMLCPTIHPCDYCNKVLLWARSNCKMHLLKNHKCLSFPKTFKATTMCCCHLQYFKWKGMNNTNRNIWDLKAKWGAYY